ncbi:hypothetical protein [Noviherbaspirillum sp.]|uniref:hypothetical protein n=1 Tax=Noviherbaspirillum sp. TaxID=1926288 RepID=UPI002B48C3EC|nr:hypothetical protein [Noviherbaspirillum sp.]HJV83165.1 hypothetical protein [Noviherbaspirillum sp.]
MAQYLNMTAKQVIIRSATACLAFGVHFIAMTQVLSDPTRPPVAASSELASGQAAAGPILQSILISPHRAEAIINGQTVKVGDKVGEAKVVRITESEVFLRSGKDLQALKLFPNIEKNSTRGASAPKRTNSADQRRHQGQTLE